MLELIGLNTAAYTAGAVALLGLIGKLYIAHVAKRARIRQRLHSIR